MLLLVTLEIAILIIIFFFIALFFSLVIFSSRSFAPWVPTSKKDLEKIFDIVEIRSEDVFYDLGSGDGRVVSFVNKHFRIRSVGIERSIFLYLFCKIRYYFKRKNGLIFKHTDLFKEDLSKSDIIFIYGTPIRIREKLLEKIKINVKKGTRIISYRFSLGGFIPENIIRSSVDGLPIYLYII
jgi:hypothetical protein